MEKYFSFFGGLISGAKRMFSGLKGGNRMVATAAVKRVFSSSVGGVGKVLGGLKGGNRMVAVAAVNRVFNGLVGGAGKVFGGLKGGNRMVATAAVKRVFSSSVGGVGKVFGGLKGGNRMVAVAAVNRVFNGLVGGAGKVFGSLKGGNRTAVAVAICFAALGFAPGLRADPGEDGSSIGAMTSAKTWDTDEYNGYTFAGEDSINVENIAVNITAGEASKEFTLNFQNDPSVRTDIADPTKTDTQGPEVEDEYIQAHIYAHNTDGDTTGINLADGVNLTILVAEKETDTRYRPTIAAYRSGSDDGAAVVIRAPGASIGNEINVAVPLLLHASSSSSSYSAAALFGAASGEGAATVSGTNNWALGHSNNLSASTTTSYYSAAALFGAASGYAAATVSGVNNWTLGNGNTLSASSSGYYSAAALFGAASGNGAAAVSGKNKWALGDSNILSAASSLISDPSTCSSAAALFGAASGNGAATVGGENIWTLWDGNTLSASSVYSHSSSYSYSAAVVFGAAAYNTATVDGTNNWALRDSNTLSATSSGSAPSAAALFGAASGYDTTTVSGENIWFLGNGNNLSASSLSPGPSAAALFGAASGNGAATVNGENSWTLWDGNNLSVSSSSSVQSAAAIFGAASGYGATVSGTNNWTLENGNNLSASSSGYSSAAALFGAASGNGAATVGGENIWALGDSNTLSVSSSGSYSAAALFGAASGYAAAAVSGMNNWAFGDSNILSAASSLISDPFTYSSAAALFGAAAYGTATVNGENSWTLWDGNTLSASSVYSHSSSYSYSAAVVFGAAAYDTATVDGTNNWALRDSNTLSATSSGSALSAAAIFGAASGNDTTTVSGTNIWTLGNGNNLSASSLSPGPSAVALFGAASGQNTATVSGKNKWALGNDNNLSASSLSDSNSAAALFGAASGYGATVSGKNNWALGNGNSLSVASASDSCSAAALFGAASGYDATVNGINNWTLGDSNNLSITSSSSSSYSYSCSAAALFGAAAYGAATVSGTNNWTLGDGNNLSATLSSSSSSSSSYSAAALFGAASGYGYFLATASGVAVSANGSQTLSALAHCQDVANIRVNAFGADITDMCTYTEEEAAEANDGAGEGGPISGAFGWRVGIFAAGEDILEGEEPKQKTIAFAVKTDSTVNILAAKLEKAVDLITDQGKAAITLGADQGSSSADYARAFALGNDFKIYIGGRVDPSKDKTSVGDNYGFVPVAPNGKANVVNIFGAISKGGNSSDTANSSLIIDSGWTVNAYGPVEDLASIDVKNGTLNTYGSLKNITIDGGTVNAYGASDGVGTLRLKNGVLHVGRAPLDAPDSALDQIAENFSFTDPATKTIYKGADGNVTIDDSNYPWKGSATGTLTINGGDVLEFHFDSSQKALDVVSAGDGFELAKGYITVESHGSPVINLQGGTFKFVDDGALQEGIAETTDILLVRCSDKEPHTVFTINKEKFEFEPISPESAGESTLSEEEEGENTWNLMSIGKQPSLYEINDFIKNLGLRYYGGTGLVLCSEDELPRVVRRLSSRPSEFAQSHANGELATSTTASTLMVQDAIATRFADVKGNSNDPFLLAVAGHTHQGKIGGFGYSSDLYGLTGGVDYLCNLQGERYLRLGTVLGYIRGDTRFNGAASGLKKTARQNMYFLALFGAYEAFDPQSLKTNVNFYTGLGYGSNRLFRVDANNHAFYAKLKSNNAFFSLEVTKNLYAWQGTQFGLWLKADYNHIKQKGYSETSPNGGTECDHVSRMDFNFLTTVLGINIEKEIDHPSRPDRRLRLYARAGWSCQAVREHSKGVAWIEGLQSGNFTPTLGFPSRHGAVFVAGFRNKLNAHWDIIGQWNAHFSKDQSNNIFSLGTGYNF